MAGGGSLSSELKVRRSGPSMLRATIDAAPALRFVFETPNSADVLVAQMARRARSVGRCAETRAAPWRVIRRFRRRASAVGTCSTVRDGRVAARGPTDVEPASRKSRHSAPSTEPSSDAGPGERRLHRRAGRHRWERSAVVLLRCDPDSGGRLRRERHVARRARITMGAEAVTTRADHSVGGALRRDDGRVLPATPPLPVSARVRLTHRAGSAAARHGGRPRRFWSSARPSPRSARGRATR